MTDIKLIFKNLLNVDKPEYLRAVDLFEWQLSALGSGANVCKRARKIAAIPVLDLLERRAERSVLTDSERAAFDALQGELMREGLMAIRRLPSDRAFARKLRKQIEKAEFAANVVDFLCRYAVSPKTRRPSLELAQYVARRTSIGGAELSKASAQSRWLAFSKEPILVHLLFTFELMPPQISTRQFADELMAQIRNLDSIKNLFAARNSIIATLAINVGEPIAACELPTFRLQYEPIEPSLQRIIEEYRLAID
jgi:hypothetical protein